MKNKLKGMLIAVAAIAALAAGGAAIASATGGGDDDGGEKPIQGAALERARAAALDRVGGGRVTETEAGDEEGAYEVEVTRGDGSEVDVHLDGDFQVVGVEADAADDRDDAADDDDDGDERDDD